MAAYADRAKIREVRVMKGKYEIGDVVEDEDGNTGIVGIMYNDGDFCTIENDAAHPNPVKMIKV
jgi:uncharacterized protein YkvS